MTVCIGAICDNELVICADRMITYGPPMSLQVESAVRKIVPISKNAAILFSGNVPEGEWVINKTKSYIDGITTVDMHQVATYVTAAYQQVKEKKAEDIILRPSLGVDYAGFRALVAQTQSSQILQQVAGMLMGHNLQLDLMLAGIDSQGPHLFAIGHPDTMATLDTVGYAAIGSGGLHAAVRLSLGGQTKEASRNETVVNVYEAKLAAQSAPGVGGATDLAFISTSGIKFADASLYTLLSEIHKERPALSSEDLRKLTEECARYGSAT